MDLALWEYAALMLAGIVAGFINVMAGGGSIIGANHDVLRCAGPHC